MPNNMHAKWLQAKNSLQREIDNVKQNGGMNPKQVKDALKTFDQGFGPLLEKLGTAYKDKKDAEAKKQAGAALTIAERYLATLKSISNGRGGGAEALLGSIIRELNDVRAKGSAAYNH